MLLQVATWLLLDGFKKAFKDIIKKAFNFNLDAERFIACKHDKEDSDHSAIILSLMMGIVSVTFAQYQR